jgi:hypothetical protein
MKTPKQHIKTLDVIAQTRAYLDYVEEHVLNVQKAWEVFKVKCNDECGLWDDFRYFSINDAVTMHDFSKLSADEFVQYRRKFYPVDGEDAEEATELFKNAWEHHKEHNTHHWENWTTSSNNHPHFEAVAIAEMVIDWMAMGYKFGDTPREYYERNKDKIDIPANCIPYLLRIFDALEA